MNRTLALPQIAEQLVKITGCSHDEATRFVVDFSDIIGEALECGESVEIAGIGSFRSVNAGGDVAFIPEEALTEAVNAPFAMFEPVELDDDVTEYMLECAVDEPLSTSSESNADTSENIVVDNQDEAARIKAGVADENAMCEISGEPDDSDGADTEGNIHALHQHEMAETAGVETDQILPESAEPEREEGCANSVASGTVATEDVPDKVSEEPEQDVDLTAVSERGDTEPVSATTPTQEDQEQIAPGQAKNDATPIYRHEIRTERYDYYDNETNGRHSVRSMNLNSILIAFLALLAGLLIGYFGHSMLNLSGVRSVNISAEDVQVYHQLPQPEEIAASADNLQADTIENRHVETDTSAAEPQMAAPLKVVEETNEASNSAVTDTVKGGRFLTTIAQRHYGKKKFWVYIYLENADKLGDPDMIPPMTVVTIPSLEKYGVRADDESSEKDAERKATEILNRYSKNK